MEYKRMACGYNETDTKKYWLSYDELDEKIKEVINSFNILCNKYGKEKAYNALYKRSLKNTSDIYMNIQNIIYQLDNDR